LGCLQERAPDSSGENIAWLQVLAVLAGLVGTIIKVKMGRQSLKHLEPPL